MTADEARLKLLVHAIGQEVPGFEIKFKNQSAGQRFLGRLLFFMAYMTDFISTFYPRVWWTTREDYKSSPWGTFKILAHEYVHLLDTKKHPVWFRLSYVLPVPLVVLSFGALAAIWLSGLWLLWLVALVFVAPLPALFRMRWEMRGYAMSMAVNAWKYGSITDATKEWISSQFTGWSYYKMWPFKKGVRKRLDDLDKQIHNGDILVQSRAFQQVKRICQISDVDAVAEAGRLQMDSEKLDDLESSVAALQRDTRTLKRRITNLEGAYAALVELLKATVMAIGKLSVALSRTLSSDDPLVVKANAALERLRKAVPSIPEDDGDMGD